MLQLIERVQSNLNDIKDKSYVYSIMKYICYIVVAVFIVSTVTKYKNDDYYKYTFGYKPVIVITGSMEPTIKVNSVSIIKKCTIDDLNIGDIVMYRMYSGVMITHRVINIRSNNGVKFLDTKGDANSKPDYIPITDDMIYGKVVAVFNGMAPIMTRLMVEPGTLNTTLIYNSVMFIIVVAAITIMLIRKIITIIKVVYLTLYNDARYTDILEEYKKSCIDHIEICNRLANLDTMINDMKDGTMDKFKYNRNRVKLIKELEYLKITSNDVKNAAKEFDNTLK